MAETQRLGVWGWFVRAFAGGIGAMFGVMTALMFACVACYVLFAVAATALSSFGAVNFEQPIVLGGTTNYSATECAPLALGYPNDQGSVGPYSVSQEQAAYATEPAAYAEEPAAVPAYEANSVEIPYSTAKEAE